MSKYNGWSNYETWNIALWLGNDEGLYNIAKRYDSWKKLKRHLDFMNETPDGVKLDDEKINTDEIDNFLKDLF